jgi:tetratricopeptide (TPR) repeat protein
MVTQTPEALMGWKVLAWQAIEQGQGQRALAPLSRAMELAPEDAHLYVLMASALGQMAQTNEAEMCLREAMRRDPNRLDAPANLASLLLDARRLDEALAACEQALAIDRRSPELHLIHGNIFDLGAKHGVGRWR